MKVILYILAMLVLSGNAFAYPEFELDDSIDCIAFESFNSTISKLELDWLEKVKISSEMNGNLGMYEEEEGFNVITIANFNSNSFLSNIMIFLHEIGHYYLLQEESDCNSYECVETYSDNFVFDNIDNVL